MICKWFERECEQADKCNENRDDVNMNYCPEFLAVYEYVKRGHTRHCAARLVWGDGECECREKKGGEAIREG